jgi:hypothetical protein
VAFLTDNHGDVIYHHMFIVQAIGCFRAYHFILKLLQQHSVTQTREKVFMQLGLTEADNLQYRFINV